MLTNLVIFSSRKHDEGKITKIKIFALFGILARK
jgi:hypothetical protein